MWKLSTNKVGWHWVKVSRNYCRCSWNLVLYTRNREVIVPNFGQSWQWLSSPCKLRSCNVISKIIICAPASFMSLVYCTLCKKVKVRRYLLEKKVKVCRNLNGKESQNTGNQASLAGRFLCETFGFAQKKLKHSPPSTTLPGCWTMVFFRIFYKRILSEGRQKAGIHLHYLGVIVATPG